MPITHPFVSAKADGPDATLVRPSNWNADHIIGEVDASVSDARTATVNRPLIGTAQTSGVPAADIGVGILLRAESADEAPSNFGALDARASDVGAGTEDTYWEMLIRVAGAALAPAYRWAATTAFRAIFTHANSADRTYTLPNSTGTVALTTDANETGTWSANLAGGSRLISTVYQNTSGRKRRVVIRVSGPLNGNLTNYVEVGSANPPTLRVSEHVTVLTVASGTPINTHSVEVPNNWYIRLVDGGSQSLTSWHELDE